MSTTIMKSALMNAAFVPAMPALCIISRRTLQILCGNKGGAKLTLCERRVCRAHANKTKGKGEEAQTRLFS